MLATLLPALKDLGLPLKLQLWDGKEMDIGPAPSVTLVIKDPNLVTQLARPSLDVLGAAYVEGHIDLLGPVEEVIYIGDVISRALSVDDFATPMREAHDKATDAEAISYHYDLSNDFYRLWLDRDMVYSCAYFESGEEDIDQAQQAKLRLICRKLRLKPGDRLLDVGTTTKRNFGSLLIHLEFNCPFMPTARGMQRGNSGIYVKREWEVQIIDSFGWHHENRISRRHGKTRVLA